MISSTQMTPYFPSSASMIALSLNGTRCLLLVSLVKVQIENNNDIHLSVSTLVDQFTNRLEVGVTVSDEWLNNSQHLDSGLGKLDEDAVVDLEKTKKLKGLALLWIDLVDTLDTNNKGELWFGRDVERSIRLCNTAKSNLLSLLITIFLDIGLGTLEDSITLLLVGLDIQVSTGFGRKS
jgi:hypothetical protein